MAAAAVVALIANGVVLGASLVSACHPGAPITIEQNADPLMYEDASDRCATACGNIVGACCVRGDEACAAPWARCAPNCRNDQAQGVGAMFPVDCVLDAGMDAAALAACNVTCP